MMTVYKQKKSKNVFLTLFALLFCAISFLGFPVGRASAEGEIEDDFDAFYQDFMQMVVQYDTPKDDGIATINLLEEENEEFDPGYQSRLIVTTNQKIDDFGAVASCHYKNHYYFQYEDYEDTDKAYEHFAALDGVSVMYDYKTTINEDKIEINASSYHSWGWNAQNDYTGANSYLTTLMETVSKENLTGQVVAVLDTGINPNHRLFSGRILTKFAKDFTGEGSWVDTAGHGSHVSGTIAEITPASYVKILPLRVLDANGEGLVSYITGAIDYAIRAKAQIEKETGFAFKLMNMSLGIKATALAAAKSHISANAGAFDLTGWVEEAYSKGLLSIVSAGNTITGGVPIKYAPANISNAIVVSALARTLVSSAPLMYDYTYSDYGPTVDFAAPGTSIESAGVKGVDSTATMSGTSMAAPHVTACVALIYMHPDFKNLDFEALNKLLRENADRSMIYQNKYALSPTAVKNNYYGYGIINIKNIGMVIEGEITYSVENRFSDSGFNLKLSTNLVANSNQTVEIYYTTNESAENVSSSNGTLYNNSKGIQINNSTKILATAFVKQNGVVVKRTNMSSRIYYIANQDLASRYKIVSGAITQYLGNELTKLVIPSQINGMTITQINNKVFNDSPVENLILPSTVRYINANAFDANTKLKEIHCQSAGVQVGNYAFQRCLNLSVVDIPNITSLGQLAFAYSSSIDEMKLLKVTSIGKNAFSASSLKSIFIGKNIQSIGSHTQMQLKEVYGYAGTASETFADANSADFYDLTIRTFENIPSQKVIREGQQVSFRVICAGYGVEPTVVGAGSSVSISKSGDLSRTVFEITISNLRTGNYNILVNLTDQFGDAVSTNVMRVVVVPRTTESFVLRYNDAEYYLYVDGELVTSDVELFKGQTYSIVYIPYDGYNINSVNINGVPVRVNTENLPYVLNNVSEDVVVDVKTIEKDSLTVNFISEHGDVYVNGELLTVKHKMVERNGTIRFKIESDQGWIVKKVLVDGKELAPVNGEYVISNIISKKDVEIKFEEANYLIEITFVNSCGSFIVSNGGNLSNVAHGSSREITISAFDGYAIDFVSIDGKLVKVVNGTFTIDSIDSNKEVIVSFKPVKVSLFKRDNSIILYYFIVLLALFVLFVVGDVTMKIVRKKKKEE